MSRYMDNMTENHDDSPFGGILGNNVIVRIVEELIADPESVYSPTDLSELTSSSAPQVRKSIERLLKAGFVKPANRSEKRPVYKVDTSTNKFVALTLLAYAAIDDKEKTNLMLRAIKQYLKNNTKKPSRDELDKITKELLKSYEKAYRIANPSDSLYTSPTRFESAHRTSPLDIR